MAQKTLEKLRQTLQDGNFYEAHQMIHSACQRLSKKNKTEEAIELLHSGARIMAEHNQPGSAIDLVDRLLDTFATQPAPLSDANRGRLMDLFAAFPLETEVCDQFTRMCIKWSIKHQESQFGDPLLHHAFGARYFKCHDYYDAELHFVYGNADSAKLLGNLAFECSELGIFPDPGYFAARAVLQCVPISCPRVPYASVPVLHADWPARLIRLVAINKVDEAQIALNTFLDLFTKAHPDAAVSTQRVVGRDITIFSSDYLNIAQITLEALDRNSPDVFSNALTAFRPTLSQDEYLLQLGEIIASLHFHFGPRVKQVNPLAEMMKSMFGGPASSSGGRTAIGGPTAPLDMD
ncbi:hypothetical protein HK105_202001 [Polyrhizophydium stewartii]|uniref:Uncharacterized protein n=1 Tax=Polyrhizophydium stewartii TaxID=2732419 RepID=A0ABR4NGK9_9FUNG